MKKKLLGILVVCFISIMAAACADSQMVRQQQEGLKVQIIKETLELNKQSFKSIQAIKVSDNEYAVQVELTPEATKQLHKLMSQNINQMLAIVWHRYVLSAATIQSPWGQKFQIAGLTQQQAEELVKEIQSK